MAWRVSVQAAESVLSAAPAQPSSTVLSQRALPSAHSLATLWDTGRVDIACDGVVNTVPLRQRVLALDARGKLLVGATR